MHQLIINDFQGPGELVNQDAPMAYINVSDEVPPESDGLLNIDIASLRLTNGMPKGDIKVEDVQNQ